MFGESLSLKNFEPSRTPGLIPKILRTTTIDQKNKWRPCCTHDIHRTRTHTSIPQTTAANDEKKKIRKKKKNRTLHTKGRGIHEVRLTNLTFGSASYGKKPAASVLKEFRRDLLLFLILSSLFFPFYLRNLESPSSN